MWIYFCWPMWYSREGDGRPLDPHQVASSSEVMQRFIHMLGNFNLEVSKHFKQENYGIVFS